MKVLGFTLPWHAEKINLGVSFFVVKMKNSGKIIGLGVLKPSSSRIIYPICYFKCSTYHFDQ